jgi:hypothetical protein
MVKTILLPTDFSIRSLQPVRYALEEDSGERLNVIHVVGLRIPQSITELLFFSREDFVKKLSGEVFNEACQVIRNKYASRINEMRIEIFTGLTQGAFNLFLDGQGIDKMYIPENKLNFHHPCFDPTPFMKKSKVLHQTVSWHEKADELEYNSISVLFKNWA